MANAKILVPLAIANATASSTAVGAATNVGIDLAGLIWESNSGSTASIDIDLGANTAFDTIMVFGLAKAAPGATLTITAATAAQGPTFPGGSWVGSSQAAYAGTAMLLNGRGMAYWEAPSISPPPASRYIRLSFASLSATAVQIGRIVIGSAYAPSRNFVFGGAFGIRDFGNGDFSNRAVFYRRKAAKLRTAGIRFSNTYKDEVEAKVALLLETVGNTGPVGLITDPAAHANRMRRMYFGPLQGDLGNVQRNPVAWEWQANLVSLF